MNGLDGGIVKITLGCGVGCAITGLDMYSEGMNLYSEMCNVLNTDDQTALFHATQEHMIILLLQLEEA